jgi:hypothetical protein
MDAEPVVVEPFLQALCPTCVGKVVELIIILIKRAADTPYLQLQRLYRCSHLQCKSCPHAVVLDEHIYHPYCLLDGETEQTNATKSSVHGSPLSFYIPIYPQKGQTLKVFGLEDPTSHSQRDG